MSEAAEPLELLERSDVSLLDTVDHLLNKGLVLTGEVVVGLAGVDLIYLRLTALLCAADRILPRQDAE
ncbi:MAG TPA: gas vesicle protein [Thermoanaerobaculia bacterium]|nr:gas vesicle protein [Thermoanaerobaculia bacterium]